MAYFNAVSRYEEFMEDSEIIYAILELVPKSTKYYFLRIVYQLEQEKKLVFRNEDKKQWTSGYIYYNPENNQIVIEYDDAKQIIPIPEEWEL